MNTLPRLHNCHHRREWKVGENTVVAAPGWSLFVQTPQGEVRLDPSRVDDFVTALKEAKQHQRGRNPQ